MIHFVIIISISKVFQVQNKPMGFLPPIVSASKHSVTYTDISVQPSGNIKKLITEIGSERLLFGTDYPFVSQAFSILSVLRATEIEQERINIFSGNAKKLLNV